MLRVIPYTILILLLMGYQDVCPSCVAIVPGTRLTDVFTTSKKMLPQFPPGDVVQVQHCRSSVAGLGRRLFYCESLSGFMVHGSFGNPELGCRDNRMGY